MKKRGRGRVPVAAVCRALANPGRLKVFCVICRHAGRRGAGMARLCRATGMKQPAVSHHVARLAAAGLVARRKEGWWVYCTPLPGGLEALARFARRPSSLRV